MTLVEEVLAVTSARGSTEAAAVEAAKQQVRVRFFLSGVAVTVLSWLVLVYAEFNGLARPGAAACIMLVALACQGGIGLAFYTGLNRRLSEKSLTLVQVAAYGLMESLVILLAPPLRHSWTLMYCVSLTFGIVRLRGRQALALSLFIVCCYFTAVLVLWRQQAIPHDLPAEAIHFANLALFMLCFASVAGYVNRLRGRADAVSSLHEQGLPLDLKSDFGVAGRSVEPAGFRRAVRSYDRLRKAGRAHFTLAEFALDNPADLAAVLGQPALSTVERHLSERLLRQLPAGALVCAAGGGRVLAMLPQLSLAAARQMVRVCCAQLSGRVLVLPDVAKPVVVRLSARVESLE
jgi:hypothetical protein